LTCSNNSCHNYYGTNDPWRWGGAAPITSSASYTQGTFCGEVTVTVSPNGGTGPYKCYFDWLDGSITDWSDDCSATHYFAQPAPDVYNKIFTVKYSARDKYRVPTDPLLKSTLVVAKWLPGCPDPNSTDSDSDGMSDAWENTYGLNPLDPSDANIDMDGDGLTNLYEFTIDTNPTLIDTDGDGVDDGHDGFPLDNAQSVCPDIVQHLEGGSQYGTVWSAYSSGLIQSGDTIQITASDHNEDLFFNQNIVFTLSGGYECSFSNNPVSTEITGTLTISGGTLTVEKIVMK